MRFMNRAIVIAMAALAWIVPRALSAQEDRAVLKGSTPESSVTWWVVGTGGVLNSSNDEGDTLSGTLGQTGIDSTTASDSTYGRIGYGMRGSALAYLGFWLPRSTTPQLEEPFDEERSYRGVLALRNYPNPFRTTTAISYMLPARTHVRVKIYNTVGDLLRTLVDEEKDAGLQTVIWDGMTDAGGESPSGSYIYTVETSLEENDADAGGRQTERGIMYRIR